MRYIKIIKIVIDKAQISVSRKKKFFFIHKTKSEWNVGASGESFVLVKARNPRACIC